MRHDSGHFTPTKARGLWRAALLGGVLAWGGITQAQTNALSFDGIDDRVDCGTSPSLNLTGNAVTLEAWIYPTAWRDEAFQGNIINKEQDSNNSGYMLRCGANGTLNFNVGGEGEWHEVNSAANALTLNTWQHVAGVYDGSTLHLYLNGVEITTDAVSFNVGNSTNPLVIGDWADGVGRNYPGLIDEVRVWNKAVDGATLLANMNTKYCGNETGLIAYYRFDQGTAGGTNTTETTLNDQTGYTNNGTLTGFDLDGTSSNWVTGQTNMADCVPVACPSPILLTISNASTSGFDLTWTDTEASSYEYEVRTAGAAGSGATGLFTSGTVATGATPVAINGIAANTSYQAYVRASCDGGVFSDWSPATSIYTGYCNPAPTSVDGDGITNVTFGGVDNTTTTEDNNYGDYTAMVGAVQQSTIATVNITFETGYTYDTKIWVDWNNDFDFNDPGENVYTGTSTNANPTTLIATFPIGTNPLGQHRMRIGALDVGPPTTCYSGTYGTFEDYTLLVDPPPACVAPTGLTAAATSTTDGMANWNVSSPIPAGGYDVYYSIDATSPDDATVPNFTAVPDTFQVLSGLPQGVAIHVWVRSHCSDASLSAWSVRADMITNDDCLGAISCPVNPDQSCSVTTPGTVAGATASGLSTTCFGTPDDDVWFSFVATGTTQWISLTNSSGSTTDLYHALWTGVDCSSLSLVAGSCSDGDFSSSSGLMVGQTYYVQVYTYTSTPGQNTQFSVCIGTPPPPPANDDCVGAISCTVNPDQSCSVTTPGTVAGATASGLSTTCYGTPDDDVWFSFVATGTTQLVSLINSSGSTTDLYHALWSGADCSSLSLVDGSCSDGDNSSYSGLTVGETYYVQVYTYTSTPGQNTVFDVCIGTPPPPPANDECDGAYPVAVNPYNYDCMTPTAGTVAGATASGLSTTCFGTPNDDVWFTFVATSTEHRISLTNITGSTSDMYMALWTGDCGSLALVPGSCSDPQTLNMTGLTVGTTYYLQVYSYTSSSGQTSAFDVCIGTPPTCFPPENITLDSFTAPDASISWDDNGALSFDYEVRTSGAPGSGATGLVQSGNVAASPLSLSGLNATDVYSVYIRSNCSDVNISSWSSAVLLFTGYCPASSTGTTYYLTDFSTTGGTDNITNTNSGLSANGYGDFTDMVVSQYPGAGFDFSAGFSADQTYYLYIWVDWNNDLDFDDDGEQMVATANYQSSPYSGSIAVPEGTPAGDYRMRVRNSESGVVGPCGSINYGEAEDYTLTVLQPDPCAGMPDPGATTGPSVICADVPFTLSVENAVIEGGLNYQWQVSSDGVNWTDAPGSSTLSHYTTSQTVETWYQLQVTCEFGSVATSTPLDVTMAPGSECYCTTLNYTNNVEPICNVTFADINNDSPSELNATPEVEDFTAIVGHVTQGSTYTLSVTGNTDGNYTTYITAFFDWDGNGSWETVTPIGTIVNDDCTTPTTGDITVPVDALVGTSRMRVVKLFNASPTDPCATYSFGQTEDYTLDVSAPMLDCEGTVDGPALPGTPCIYAPSGYGGMWSADCVCIENVGVGEIAGNTGFAIYPNPASSILYITTANNAPVHVKVYDMVGTLVIEKDMVQQLNITKLATGSYTLVATDSKGMNERHARFMKQ